MLKADYDIMAITIDRYFSSYINISFHFFTYKNRNTEVVTTRMPVANMSVINILIADYNTIVIARSKPFLSYIKTSYYFSACKNYNVRKTILAIGELVTNELTTSILISSVLVVTMLIVGISAISLSVAKVFLSHRFLAIFPFLIIKIAI